jgi:hypothetical protein
MVGSDLFVAATIGTQRLAKGQMNVKGDSIHMVLLCKFFYKQTFPGFCLQLIVPERNGGIAGITGQREIILPYQQGVH